MTRIVLDADGADAKVTEIVERAEASASAGYGYAYGVAELERPLCIVPCAVDMKPGMHTLSFTSRTDDRKSRVDIQVGARSKAVRHAMGRTSSSFVGEFLASTLATLGATAVVLGGVMYAAADDDPETKKYRSPATAMITAGAAAFVISIPLLLATRPTVQSGSTTEIPLGPGPEAR